MPHLVQKEKTPQEARAALRARMNAARLALSPAEAAARSRAIQAHILRQPFFAAAASIALYMAVKGEAGTDGLLRAALAAGKSVWLPRVLPDCGLEFAAIDSPDDLAPGPFGLLEPRGPGLGPADFAPDLMLVPGLCFDRAGHRLGYGGGYYDRFIGASPRRWTMAGVAYNFQLAQIPPLPHDLRLEWICREDGCLAARPGF